MGESHSKYYNYTPEEAFKKFRTDYKIRAIIFMVIIVVILIGMLILYENWHKQIIFNLDAPYLASNVLGLFYILTMAVITFLGIKIGLPLVMRPSVQLLNIFWGDCDPVKMYDIYVIWEQSAKTEKRKDVFLLEKAQCCRFIPERWEEGKAYLEQVDFKKKRMDMEVTRLFNIAAYAKYRNDRTGFEQAKADIEQLSNQYPGNKIQKKNYERTIHLLTIQELLWDGKDAEARTMINSFLETEVIPLNQVMFRMHLARLDMKEQKYENARKNLEYVIDNGNRLPVVPEAMELLEVCKKESDN